MGLTVAGLVTGSLPAIPTATAATLPGAASFGPKTAAFGPATPALVPATANRLVRNDALYGVSCTSWQQCMAVGSRASARAVNFGPLAERWDGTRWRVVPTPGPAKLAHALLTEVSCRSGRDCVATGYHYRPGGNGFAVLAEHWNGTRWRIIQSRNPATAGSAFLNGVSCRGSVGCMAVGGYSGRSGEGHALAEQWANGRWRILRLHWPAGARSTELDGLSCVGRFCMAVGMYANASGQVLSLAERWTGASWQLLHSANPGVPISVLQDVSCHTTSLCMAIGFTDWSRERPLAELWMNGSWRLVPGGRLAGGALNGISCRGPIWCIAVGSVGNKPLSETWSGKSWWVVQTQQAGDRPANQLNQLSCSTRTVRCIAVGARYEPGQSVKEATLAEWWNGRSWRVMTSRNP